ncbi:MAG TPA: FAD-binding oxidoreductase [Chitinophaga sp.]
MESHIVKINAIRQVTHDVKSFKIEKPAGYQFTPGQATEVSINKPGWEEERRPFTFTSLNQHPWLEFTIKRYADHDGVTNLLHQLNEGDELIIRDVWGAIEYKGPGYFIAGGAGITPFMAILRQLHEDKSIEGNVLFFSNKTAADVIYEEELSNILGSNAHFILTQEKKEGYENGFIDMAFLQKNIPDFTRHFYICGPDKMIHDINAALEKSGARADLVVFEK